MTKVGSTQSSSAQRQSVATPAQQPASITETKGDSAAQQVAQDEVEAPAKTERQRKSDVTVGHPDRKNTAPRASLRARSSDRVAALRDQSGDGPLLTRGLQGRSASEATAASPSMAAGPGPTKRNAQLMQDEKAIRDATAQGPAQGAAAIEQALGREGIDAAYRQELLQNAQPSLDQISRDLAANKDHGDVVKPAIASLTSAAEASGDEGSKIIAKSMSQDFPNGDLRDLDNGFQEAIEAGRGTRLAVALTEELVNVGKGTAADDVATATKDSVNKLCDDFEKATERVDQLADEIEEIEGTTAKLLTPEQNAAALTERLRTHEADFLAHETAGARLASALGGMGAATAPDGPIARAEKGWDIAPTAMGHLDRAAQRSLRQLPRLVETPGGVATVGEALEAHGRGEASLIDGLPRAIETAGDPENMRAGMALALIDGAETRAMLQDADGEGQQIDQLGRSMAGALQSVGAVNTEEAKALSASFSELGAVESKGELKAWASGFKDVTRGLKDLSRHPRVEQRLRGFGVVAGCLKTAAKGAQVASRTGDLSKMDDVERAEILAETLEVGAKGGKDVIKSLHLAHRLSDETKKRLATRFARAGSVLAGIGVAIDGARAVDAFLDGRHLEGASYAMSAAGSALAAASAVGLSIPGGQLAGAALFAGSLALAGFEQVQYADRYQGPTEQYLKDAGFDPAVARELANYDGDGRSMAPLLLELAPRFGMSPQELMGWLRERPPEEINALMNACHRVKPDDDGVFPVGGRNDWIDEQDPYLATGMTVLGRPLTTYPGTVNGLLNYMDEFGLMPGPVVDDA